MGDLIYAEFNGKKRGEESTSPLPSKSLVQMSDFVRRNVFQSLIFLFTGMMVLSLWWTDGLLYGFLLFIAGAVIVAAVAITLTMWAEHHSPDWDQY